MEKFLDATASPQTKSHVPLQESLSSDSSKNQKRPAPKPPSPKEDLSHRYETIFTELETSETELKQPEVAETSPKRISRSTENLLEFITDQEEKNQLSTDGLEVISTPEPVPRRSLSLSQDNLSPSEAGYVRRTGVEKKKKR